MAMLLLSWFIVSIVFLLALLRVASRPVPSCEGDYEINDRGIDDVVVASCQPLSNASNRSLTAHCGTF
jgi:hypothetical protein